jgi:hypothetical protein
MVPRDANRIVTGRTAQRGILARRRRAFTGLSTATAGSFLLAVLYGGPVWLLFVAAGAGLGGYVALLLNLKAQRQQAARVVRQLSHGHVDDPRLVQEPELARAAVGAEPYGEIQVATGPNDPWQTSSGVRIRRWEA